MGREVIFATKVKTLRLLSNRSTRDTAKALDIEPAYYSTIENGKRFPGKKTLRRIKSLYGIEDDRELFEVTENVNRLVGELSKCPFEDIVMAYSLIQQTRLTT